MVHLIHYQTRNYMRRSFLLFLLIGMSILGIAQNGQNPFDLSTPSSEEVAKAPVQVEEQKTTSKNPFDLRTTEATNSAVTEPIKPEKAENNNPFDLSAAQNELREGINKTIVSTKPSPVIEEDNSSVSKKQNNWILVLSLFILAVTTVVFIFFRSLYAKVYKAIFSNNHLLLLYRERQAGAFGGFFIAYGLFFLSFGLFIYLALVHLNKLPEGDVLKYYSLITVSLAAIFIAKHFLLSLIAYIFPIGNEVRIYSFTIMIFAIVLGMVLTLADFILAYSPEGIKLYIMYFIGLLFLVIYLLRSLRGLFIANRFAFNYLFHFLLYLCAVEIAPALIVYKMIFSFQG